MCKHVNPGSAAESGVRKDKTNRAFAMLNIEEIINILAEVDRSMERKRMYSSLRNSNVSAGKAVSEQPKRIRDMFSKNRTSSHIQKQLKLLFIFR